MNKIDEYLWKVKLYLMKRYGCDAAGGMIYPLVWYVRTGRSTAQFDRELMTVKPFVIGRLLAKEGSVDEAVSRIQKKVAEKSRAV